MLSDPDWPIQYQVGAGFWTLSVDELLVKGIVHLQNGVSSDTENLLEVRTLIGSELYFYVPVLCALFLRSSCLFLHYSYWNL